MPLSTSTCESADQPDCFVVNMDGATDRWAHVEREFGREGLVPTRFAALTSADVTADLVSWRLEEFLEEGWTNGEVGCLMSHMAIWRRIVDAGLPFAAVFEDDIVFGQDAGRLISSLQFPAEPTIKKLETWFQLCFVGRRPLAHSAANAHYFRLISQHKGTGAYALNSAAASELLRQMKASPSRADVRTFTPSMLAGSILIEQLVPAIATQQMFLGKGIRNPRLASTIAKERWQTNLAMERRLGARIVNWFERLTKEIVYRFRGRRMVVPFLDRNGRLFISQKRKVPRSLLQRGIEWLKGRCESAGLIG